MNRLTLQGADCRWWGTAWWCVATPPLARVAAPPVATTTSPFNCRQHFALLNLLSTQTLQTPHRTTPDSPLSSYSHRHRSPSSSSSLAKCVAIFITLPLLVLNQPRPASPISIAPLAHSGKTSSAESYCRTRDRGGDILS